VQQRSTTHKRFSAALFLLVILAYNPKSHKKRAQIRFVIAAKVNRKKLNGKLSNFPFNFLGTYCTAIIRKQTILFMGNASASAMICPN